MKTSYLIFVSVHTGSLEVWYWKWICSTFRSSEKYPCWSDEVIQDIKFVKTGISENIKLHHKV